MSKSKNKYKPQKRYGSLKSDGMIIRGAFSMETAKWFVVALLVVFHILPLVFLAFGDIGKNLLSTVCMTYLNPTCIFVILMIYGVRVGFNFKMPMLATVIAAASIAMYYTDVHQEAYVYYTFVSTLVMFFVYGIFSFVSAIIGAFIKHFLI